MRLKYKMMDEGNLLQIAPQKFTIKRLWGLLALLIFTSLVFIIIGIVCGIITIDKFFTNENVFPHEDAFETSSTSTESKRIFRNYQFIQPIELDTLTERDRRSLVSDEKQFDIFIPYEQKPRFKKQLNSKLRPIREAVDFETGSSEIQQIAINYLKMKTKIRDKRTILKLNELETAYIRCKKDTNAKNCKPIFAEMYMLAKEVTDKVDQMSQLLKDLENQTDLLAEKSEDEKKKSSNLEHTSIKPDFQQTESIFETISNASTGLNQTMTTVRPDDFQKIEESEKSESKILDKPTKVLILENNGGKHAHTENVLIEGTEKQITISPGIPSENKSTKPPNSERYNINENEIDNTNYDNLENLHRIQFQGYVNPPKIHEDLPSEDAIQRSHWNPEERYGNTGVSLIEKWRNKLTDTAETYSTQDTTTTQLLDVRKSDTTVATQLIDASKSDIVQNGTESTNSKIESKLLKHDVIDSPMLSFCEEILRQINLKNFNKENNDISNPSAAPSSAAGHSAFTSAPSHLFSSKDPGFPVTGETMKASAQFVVNPNFGTSSMPYCFHMSPGNFQQQQQMQQMFVWPHNYNAPLSLNNQQGSGGMFVMPQNIAGMQAAANINPFGYTSAPANSQTLKPNFMQSQQPIFCTYMPKTDNIPISTASSGLIPGYFNFRMRNAMENQTEDRALPHKHYPNIPSNTDIIYASYANQMAIDPRSETTNCGSDSIACFRTHQCISKSQWCDSTVDCMDASDETACSCKSRLSESKICDGYSDCPLGEDEMGCFGCDKLMFSCYRNAEEYVQSGKSAIAMCYSSLNKCDGIFNCLNGNDEKDCNLIVNGLGHQSFNMKSYTEGFLHRNNKGRWYPVCGKSEKWAKEVCESEIGEIDGKPLITEISGDIPGPFIKEVNSPSQEIDFIDDCPKTLVYVKCPAMKCGLTMNAPKRKIKESSSNQTAVSSRNKRYENDDERVIGGDMCKPMEWPFIIALYRNGKFHCGGVIFSDKWIITAAHCVIRYKNYYYEVQAGLLRRSSYSPAVQISKVSHVMVHAKYERMSMKNDLALLQLETPLKFNRWIRPICLPSKERTSLNENWEMGPHEGTICTAVGWGAVREHGPGSDHLREVKVPILSGCKTIADQEAKDICAGEPTGGRDACQGDSGGPLFCRSFRNSQEWYLAGIISHGEGCARAGEPGVYTRVAMYLQWFEENMKPENLPNTQPLQICPGYTCIWAGEKCIDGKKRCDRIIDCLGGEDEVGCVYNQVPDEVARTMNTTESNEEFDKTTEPLNLRTEDKVTIEDLTTIRESENFDIETTESNFKLSSFSPSTQSLTEETTATSTDYNPTTTETIFSEDFTSTVMESFFSSTLTTESELESTIVTINVSEKAHDSNPLNTTPMTNIDSIATSQATLSTENITTQSTDQFTEQTTLSVTTQSVEQFIEETTKINVQNDDPFHNIPDDVEILKPITATDTKKSMKLIKNSKKFFCKK